MEWMSQSDGCSVVVPKDLDGFPQSPDSWSEWDTTPFENFKSEMKRNNNRSYVGAEDCNVPGSGLCNDVDMENFGTHEESFDNASGQDLHCDMDRWSSYPPEQLEFHLDNLDSMDQLDDVFLNSLLGECPTGMDASDTDSQCSMLLADNQESFEHSYPAEHVTSNTCSTGRAKYYSAQAFTSPVDWWSQDVDNSYLLEKASQATAAHDRPDSRVNDEGISMEDSVLHHLENISAQLTEQTRMCFRDALYRLADNSKQDARQSRRVMPDQSSRWFSEEETTEMRTNVIDRTVANLLFSNIDSGVSEGSSLDLAEATNIRQWQMACSSSCDAPTFSG